MKVDDLTLRELQEIARWVAAVTPTSFTGTVGLDKSTIHGLCIVVLNNGFVYVGDTLTDEHWCIVHNAYNIRTYGTKNGLGQLALEGPQPDTKLDATGTVKAPMVSLIFLIPIQEKQKWAKIFSS